MKTWDEFAYTLRKRLGMIVLFGIFFGALSFLFLVVSQKNFRVRTDFLIIQNQTGDKDFYTIAKSNEYVGKLLSEAIYSDVFVDEVIRTGKVSNESLPFNRKDRMDEWAKRVKVEQNMSVGMISVTSYDNDKKQAMDTADAIADVLNNKNGLFRGNDQKIELRVISGPTLEKNPGTLNLLLVILGGFLMGIVLSVAWTYYFTKEKTLENFDSKLDYLNQ